MQQALFFVLRVSLAVESQPAFCPRRLSEKRIKTAFQLGVVQLSHSVRPAPEPLLESVAGGQHKKAPFVKPSEHVSEIAIEIF